MHAAKGLDVIRRHCLDGRRSGQVVEPIWIQQINRLLSAELVRQGEAIGGAPLPVHVEVEEGPPGAVALDRHDRNAGMRRGCALDRGDWRDKGADRRYVLPQISFQQGALVRRELALHSASNC